MFEQGVIKMSYRFSSLLIVVVLLFSALPVSAGEIHEAVTAGDADLVKQLLRSNPALINERDTNRMQDFPLHTAAMTGQAEIAEILLDAGAEIDCGDVDLSTPLHDACIMRHLEVVNLLIEQGAGLNRRDMHAGYSLSFAVSGGDTAIIRTVLDAGANLYYRGANGITLLHIAAIRGFEDLAEDLLAIHEDVNARTAVGMTPLAFAVERNQPGMIRFLLSHGANPGIGNEHDETPLHHAAAAGRVEIGRMLLEWGADPNAVQSGWFSSPIFYTCWDGHADFARMLIAHGADVNLAAEDRTPLSFAIDHNRVGIATALVEAGANLNSAEEEFGNTALHTATIRGSQEIVDLLLDNGIAIDTENNDGETAMSLAARLGMGDLANHFKERGAKGRVPHINQGLAEAGRVRRNEADIWFLSHSSWAIKTENHLMIFDYHERVDQPAQASLANGFVNPSELKDENVMVFASHVHGDHYDPRIWDWREQISDITYVLGFEPEGEDIPEYELMTGRQTRTIDDVKITTIESNDSGVGFLLEIDGLTILHPGDHANRLRDFSGPYQGEIDWLAENNPRPDIAFLPISGCNFGDQVAVKMGVNYALRTLKPRVFFPMHGGDLTKRYQVFNDELRDEYPNIRMEAAELRGDHFHYSDGKIAELVK